MITATLIMILEAYRNWSPIVYVFNLKLPKIINGWRSGTAFVISEHLSDNTIRTPAGTVYVVLISRTVQYITSTTISLVFRSFEWPVELVVQGCGECISQMSLSNDLYSIRTYHGTSQIERNNLLRVWHYDSNRCSLQSPIENPVWG